jgi:cohesin loading factor subunit SCC2
LTISDYLLKIFKVAVPHMPKTAAKFGQELQAALQPMIIKPSGGGGVQIMQETVGCMCVVVQHLTHDFVRLINLMKSCNGAFFPRGFSLFRLLIFPKPVCSRCSKDLLRRS